GQGIWARKPAVRYENLRLLAYLYPEVAHWFVATASPRGEAVLGKNRIATGLPGSRHEYVFNRLFIPADEETGGENNGMFHLQYLPVEEALDQFQLGWIDGLFRLAPVPAPFAAELAQ